MTNSHLDALNVLADRIDHKNKVAAATTAFQQKNNEFRTRVDEAYANRNMDLVTRIINEGTVWMLVQASNEQDSNLRTDMFQATILLAKRRRRRYLVDSITAKVFEICGRDLPQRLAGSLLEFNQAQDRYEEERERSNRAGVDKTIAQPSAKSERQGAVSRKDRVTTGARKKDNGSHDGLTPVATSEEPILFATAGNTSDSSLAGALTAVGLNGTAQKAESSSV